MSPTAGYALVLALGAVAMTGATIAACIRGARASKRVRERVLAAGGQDAGEPKPGVAKPAADPSIRMAERSQSPLFRKLATLAAYNPDNPRERSIPVAVTLMLGALVAGLAFWRARSMAGEVVAVPVAAAAGVMALRSLFGWQSRRYRDAVFKQIPETLGLILRAIRAGLPMGEALRSVAREVPEPTREEFTKVVGEITIGRPLEEALWHLYERTKLTEYAFFAVTLGLQAQTGGSLAETIENLADMVRKRVAMAAKARALASEARMSASILIALPFIAALALVFVRPGYLDVFFTTDTGFSLLMTGLSLLGMGILTIRSMIRRSTAD